MKRWYISLITIVMCALMATPAWSDSLIGFRTDTANHYTISYDGSQTVLSFGDTIVNNARYDGALVSSLLNANVEISDIIIDLSSKVVISNFGPYEYAEYALLPPTSINDGFKITIGQDVVLSGDLLLNNARFLIKSGTIDPGVALNVTNVTINTSYVTDPVAIALLTECVEGGDLTITVEDTSANDIVAALDQHSLITGIFAGTYSAIADIKIPEPLTILLIGAGCIISYLKRKRS